MHTFISSPFRAILILALFLVLILASGCSQTTPPAPVSPTAPAPQTSWEVYFSPDGGATDAIVQAVAEAKESVLVQAYSFTSVPISKALLNAHKRGVDVKVILDDSNVTARYSTADFLRNVGVPTWIDSEHAIAHNKIMIIDGEMVITGSFNFTKSAEERNAENLLIIRDKGLAGRYTENWQEHLAHSVRFGKKQ